MMIDNAVMMINNTVITIDNAVMLNLIQYPDVGGVRGI